MVVVACVGLSLGGLTMQEPINEINLPETWSPQELAEAMRAGLEVRLLGGCDAVKAASGTWQPPLTKRTLRGRVALLFGPPIVSLLSRLYALVLGPWLGKQREMHVVLTEEVRRLRHEIELMREEVQKVSRAVALDKNDARSLDINSPPHSVRDAVTPPYTPKDFRPN
jgi:hypothetical protein